MWGRWAPHQDGQDCPSPEVYEGSYIISPMENENTQNHKSPQIVEGRYPPTEEEADIWKIRRSVRAGFPLDEVGQWLQSRKGSK